MAEGFNQCVFSGNITADATVRDFDERQVASYTVAVNGRRDGDTLYLRCDHWNPGGVASYLTKGKPVLVAGDIRLDEWENRDGEKRAGIKLTVRRLQLLGSGRQEPADELAEIF
jgi:single-stranded DNA-binding protein